LRRWEELRPELDARGVEIVAISAETPDEIRRQRDKHGCRATLLADPDLAVTDRYGLRNPTNLTPKGITGMPIPTTFLVDAEGVVRWIDQSENYQVRSAPDRVLRAIREHLGDVG
jgi:peroxiredoxin